MFIVGIDVAKDKHDCFICDSEGNVLKDVFTFSNDRDGFNLLLSFMPKSCENVKVGLEDCVYSINQKSTMALLYEFPSKELIANAHITRLTNVLKDNSRGKYSKDKALEIRELAINSIGTSSDTNSFELIQTIDMINFYSSKMDELDAKIKDIMDELESPILSIPGISYNLGSIILAEIVDINRFDTPAQLQAFAGLDPATHQSGKFIATDVSMVKRGSSYLRWALLNASRLIAMRDVCFKEYYQKKRSEGKHHFVALTHVARKLIRVVFTLLRTNSQFVPQV